MNNKKAYQYVNARLIGMNREPIKWATWRHWQKFGIIDVGSKTPAKTQNGQRYVYTAKELDEWLETRRPVKVQNEAQ